MQTKTFEQTFNAVFHDEEALANFCSIELGKEVEAFTYGSRQVYKTSEKLKKYLRFIDRVILRNLENNNDVVHSYVKGKSSLTAVSAHKNSKNFFITDICAFFSSITSGDVKKILERSQYRVPISDLANYIERLVELLTYDGRVPIGFPTSPQISNSFLLDFDNALQKYCLTEGLLYTRYADDIIISSQDEETLTGIEIVISSLLKEQVSGSLDINLEKTRYTHKGNKVKILGLVITPVGQVTIDKKYKNTLESLIHFYINDKEKYQDLLVKNFGDSNKSLRDYEHSLFGLLHYAKSIDPEYLHKLQRKYGVYALTALMEDTWSAQ